MKDHIKNNILQRPPLNPSRYCPFCGAASEAKSEKGDSGKRMYYVECVQCHVRTKTYYLLSSAIKHWDNQRHNKREVCGEWLNKRDDDGCYIECSICGLQYGYEENEEPPYSKYCPECGARLVQCEQTGERKIPLDDITEAAERIKRKKVKKDRAKDVETYRRQEMAEEFLKLMIGVADEEEDEMD